MTDTVNAEEVFRYQTAQPQLPKETRALLSRLRSQEGTGDVTSDVTNVYLLALQEKGWTLRVLANGFDNVTIEAVRERIIRAKNAREGGALVDISRLPAPPAAPEKRTAAAPEQTKEAKYQIPGDVAKRMKALQKKARLVKGSTPKDHPNRAASEELAELMAQEYRNTATYSEIAEAAGVTWNAVKFRLGRYGFVALPPSMSDTYVVDLRQKRDDERAEARSAA